MYTFEQFKEDVRKEAEALKIHATVEERERLSEALLRPELIDRCIYGLMTGNCRSERAMQLIKSCCKAYILNAEFKPISGDTDWNKVYTAPTDVIGAEGSLTYLSAIEAYIILPEAKNANLIAFLRGETETLEL